MNVNNRALKFKVARQLLNDQWNEVNQTWRAVEPLDCGRIPKGALPQYERVLVEV